MPEYLVALFEATGKLLGESVKAEFTTLAGVLNFSLLSLVTVVWFANRGDYLMRTIMGLCDRWFGTKVLPPPRREPAPTFERAVMAVAVSFALCIFAIRI